jgi:hypothetical protein
VKPKSVPPTFAGNLENTGISIAYEFAVDSDLRVAGKASAGFTAPASLAHRRIPFPIVVMRDRSRRANGW